MGKYMMSGNKRAVKKNKAEGGVCVCRGYVFLHARTHVCYEDGLD